MKYTTPSVLPRRYRSPNIPMAAIKRFAQAIGERFNPEQIILFGSYATGTQHNESDVDLMVVMPAPNETNQAIRIRQAIAAPFPLDLIVRTPQHLHQGLEDEDWFLREIMATGKVVYETSDRSMGQEG